MSFPPKNGIDTNSSEEQTPREQPLHPGRALGRDMGVGLGWSLLNNFVGRLGNFLSGIVVVRLLAPEEFGTYAVGLMVLSVLLSLNELGVSVALVQHRGEPETIAPTVMTISMFTSVILAAGALLAAPSVASFMGAPEATNLVRLMTLGVVLDGIAATPNAFMSRMFMQRRRLVIDTIAFVVGTPVTIGLAISGHGAWSLGWGAVIGNLVTTVLAIVWTPVRVRPGWRSEQVPQLLRFGLPLAGSSLLLLGLLNVDKVIVGRTLGAIELGIYALAFNLCSWPITVLTSAIRRVGVALFARVAEHSEDAAGDTFASMIILVTAATAPLCLLLAGYATSIIRLLYGETWVLAAAPLVPLAIFSLVRVWVELTYDFLAATGSTISTVWLHGVWLLALAPALLLGVRIDGVRGAGFGHAVVAICIVLPFLLWLFVRAKVGLGHLFRRSVYVLFGLIVMGLLMVVSRAILDPMVAMMVGGPVSLIVFAVCMLPLRREATELWGLTTQGSKDE